MRGVARGKVLTFGFQETADVRAASVEHIREPKTLAVRGLRVTATSGARETTIELRGVLGTGHVRAALAALAAARALGVPLAAAADGLKRYTPPPGRVRLVPGVKGTVIIDDTYNSSPDAVFEALETLRAYPVPDGCRRIALLGDMLELGGYSETGHTNVGTRVAESGAEMFIGVGERMREALVSAKRAGMNEDRVLPMENAVSAARFLQGRLRAGDVVLIKGSQGMRMERAVRELMAEPERASELLCRQGKEWE
jgi:UDP-N-acetylmuramoyl-tripeptide--D-alanyl-D-alanine ligase